MEYTLTLVKLYNRCSHSQPSLPFAAVYSDGVWSLDRQINQGTYGYEGGLIEEITITFWFHLDHIFIVCM